MPFVTPEHANAVTRLLLYGSENQKLNVTRTEPINPPHGSHSNFVNSLSPVGADFSHKAMTSLKEMVGFFKLEPAEGPFLGAMTFTVKGPEELTTAASREGYVPCWFLPWRSGYIVKLTIPSVATTPNITFGPGIAPVPNPGLFTTAGINGCSVFASGAANNPTLYHGGVDSHVVPLNANETTEAAWVRLLNVHGAQGIGKTDYVSELKAGATDNSQRITSVGSAGWTNKTTAKAVALEQELASRGTLKKIDVSPWGAVFGLRNTAGNWQVSLTRNTTVEYQRIMTFGKKIQRFFSKEKASKGEFRPANLARTATGSVDYTATAGLVKAEARVTMAINLGYMDFFPGAGASHYRDLASIQVY